MGKDSGKKLLCAQVNTPLLYTLFNWVFSALLLVVLLLGIFFNTNSAYGYLWYGLLAAAAGGLVFTLLLYGLFGALPQPQKGGEIATVTILMVLLAVAQFFVGWNLQVAPGDAGAFGTIYSYASGYVLNGVQPDHFFALYPGNIGLYSLLCGYFSLLQLFGISQFGLPLVIFSMAAVDGAVLLLYFACRRLFGVRQGLLLLVIALLTAPFYLYLPMLYSDILILPIPIGMVLLWLSARGLWRQGALRKAAVRFGILSLLAALGIVLKFTVLVVWLAIAIDMLLYLRGRDRPLMLLVGFAAMALLFVGGTMALRYMPLLPGANYSRDSLPPSYEIMTGLGVKEPITGDGEASSTAGGIAQMPDAAARKAAIWQAIREDISQKGPLGLLQHLGTKLSASFGDGSYGAAQLLNRAAAPETALYEVFTPTGRYFPIFGYASYGLLAAILFWGLLAAIRSFMRKNHALSFVRVALFGLVLTLLIWQAEARYLVGFLPLFLLCALEAAPRPKVALVTRRALGREEGWTEGEAELLLQSGELPLEEFLPEELPQDMPGETVEDRAGPDYMNPSFQWEKELKQIYGQEALGQEYPAEGVFSLEGEALPPEAPEMPPPRAVVQTSAPATAGAPAQQPGRVQQAPATAEEPAQRPEAPQNLFDMQL